MAELVISALGPLQITTAHAPKSGFLSDKVRALLVYLAMEQGQPLRREALAALLWPGQPESRARANLRRALSNLRQVIDDKRGHYLHITRQTLQFNPASRAVCDAVQFEQLLDDDEPGVAQLEEAVALFKGPFLDGFSISDSIAFEEWALLKREAIQRQQLRALHRLTTYYEAHHQPETAIRYAWQQVDIEPWYEPGQRQLMRLLVQTRQRSAALTQYEQFEEVLASELGVPPEPTTRDLYKKIRDDVADRTPAQPLPVFLSEPRSVVEQPFVAREAELERLHGFLQAATLGQGQVVFVTGEAGSGKTSLLHTFARQAQVDVPFLIPFFGGCRAHTGPGNPYLPFRNILAQAVGDIESLWRNGTLTRAQVNRLWRLRQTAVKLLQDTAPDCLALLVDPTLLPADMNVSAESRPPSQEIIFHQMGHFLQAFSQYGTLLLLLDDLHWVDDASIDLLYHLRQQVAGYPVLLLCAYRPEELLPRPEATRHPLVRFVHEMTRESGEIEVALDRVDGRSFVNAWLDTEQNRLDDAFREMLFELTQGHALFTVELVAALRERGNLRQDAQGYWQVGDAVAWSRMPSRTEAIISERFGRLPPPLHQLLGVASIQGETFTAEVVAHLLDRPPGDVIHLLSSVLDRRHRLVQSEGRQRVGSRTVSRYSFRHSLFEKYVYGRLDANERAHLHQLTGNALVDLYTAGGVEPMLIAAELAYHFESAQDVEKAVTYYQLAGQYALQLSANPAAIDHFRRSLALLSTQPETPANLRQQIECGLALGAALLASQGYTSPEVKMVYDRVYELCGQVRASAETVTSLFWLTSYYATQGDLIQACTVSQKMLAVADQEAVSDMHQMQAHLLAGLPLFFMGNNEAALTHFQQASAKYEPARHQPLVHTLGQDPGIASMIWQGHVLLHMGHLSQARRRWRQALVWTSALDHPYTMAFSHLLAGATPNNGWYFRDLKAAKTHVQTALQLAQEGSFDYILAIATFYLGQIIVAICLRQGDKSQREISEGFALMHQGMEMEAAIGSKLGLSSRWVVLADAHRQCDQDDQAWHALQQAETEAHGRQELYFEPERLRVQGALHLVDGNANLAEASFQQAMHYARQQKAGLWELRATTALGSLWQQQGKQAQARQLLTDVTRAFDGELASHDVLEARALL